MDWEVRIIIFMFILSRWPRLGSIRSESWPFMYTC
jgi:hypothetical protein